ncbi:MAG: hypothetical protein ACRBFS_15020 [Aureispira sp.]
MNLMNTSSLLRPILLFGGTLFLILLCPEIAQAEAFKGGFISSGTEKALFFAFFLFVIFLVGSAIAILIGIWQWLQTGKKDRLKAYLPKVFLTLFIGLIILFVLFVGAIF